MMGDGAAKHDWLPIVEHGGDDGHVWKMGASSVRVIEDIGVTLLHSVGRIGLGYGLDGWDQAAEVDGNRVSLGYGIALDVEDGR